MHTLFQDLRYQLRLLRKSPVVYIIVILSLAIGIGANTAMFSVVNGLILRPLQYPNSDRLALLWLRSPGIGISEDWPSPGQYNDVTTQNHVFEELALAIGQGATLTGLKQPERVQEVRTTSNLLTMLGAKAMLGRTFLPEEDIPGKANTAVISHSLWTRLFGSDPRIIDRSLTLDGVQYTVVGVLRPEFILNHEVIPTAAGMDQVDIFLPLPLTAGLLNDYRHEDYNILARLKPGINLRQAQTDVDIIATHIRERDHRDGTFTISIVPLLEQVIGKVRLMVLVLFSAAALVLLIASANVANLLLSRATGRQKEIAVRTALGSGRMRLVRLLLTESIVLGLLGGAAGLLLATLSLSVLHVINPGNIPRMSEIGIDGGVLAFTFGISISTGILFGLAPMVRILRIDLNSILKAGGRGAQGGGGFDARRHKLRSFLVISELALGLILLTGAGLLVQSFVRLQNVSPGFNPDNVISMRTSLTDPKYQNQEAKIRFYEDLGERIKRLPGVALQGAASSPPFTSSGWGEFAVEGYTPPSNEPELQADIRVITDDYFRVMEIPLLQGRFFSESDTIDNQHVLVIDKKMADHFWPNENPIGKHVRPNGDPKTPWASIVGVVGPVKQYGLEAEERMVLYLPYKQATRGSLYLVARSAAASSSLSNSMVREVRNVDMNVAVYDISTMQSRLYHSLARQRFSMILMGSFACFALLLACIGVYGVLSYVVSQGTRDIGIRIMLGARRQNIFNLVIQHSLGLAVAGIIGGLIGAFILSRVMQNLLFGVRANDAVIFAVVPVLLTIIALAASYIPARRAMNVNPTIALQEE
jgi:predicted permease